MSTGAPGEFQPAGLHQSPLSRFGRDEEFELDCEDCVDFVTIRGRLDDAKTYGRRHVEARSQCDAVAIGDPDTGQDLAVVSERDFEWLSERDMPPYVAGSQ